MTQHTSFVDRVVEASQSLEKRISLNQIWEKLGLLGIFQDDPESHLLIEEGWCKEGDARAVFCEGNPPVLPVPCFRKLWAILSKNVQDEPQDKTDTDKLSEILKSNRPVSQWSDKELIENYNIDCSTEVVDELNRRSAGKKIVAFTNEKTGEVNIDLTLEILRQSRRRETPETFKQDGRIFILHRVGDFPSLVYDESPLSPGSLLWDDYCDVCKIDFSGVDKKSRQFLRIALEEGYMPDIKDRIALLGVVALAKNGFDELQSTFPDVAIIFKEMDETDSLPSLKFKQSPRKNKKADPLGNSLNKRF